MCRDLLTCNLAVITGRNYLVTSGQYIWGASSWLGDQQGRPSTPSRKLKLTAARRFIFSHQTVRLTVAVPAKWNAFGVAERTTELCSWRARNITRFIVMAELHPLRTRTLERLSTRRYETEMRAPAVIRTTRIWSCKHRTKLSNQHTNVRFRPWSKKWREITSCFISRRETSGICSSLNINQVGALLR